MRLLTLKMNAICEHCSNTCYNKNYTSTGIVCYNCARSIPVRTRINSNYANDFKYKVKGRDNPQNVINAGNNMIQKIRRQIEELTQQRDRLMVL